MLKAPPQLNLDGMNEAYDSMFEPCSKSLPLLEL